MARNDKGASDFWKVALIADRFDAAAHDGQLGTFVSSLASLNSSRAAVTGARYSTGMTDHVRLQQQGDPDGGKKKCCPDKKKTRVTKKDVKPPFRKGDNLCVGWDIEVHAAMKDDGECSCSCCEVKYLVSFSKDRQLGPVLAPSSALDLLPIPDGPMLPFQTPYWLTKQDPGRVSDRFAVYSIDGDYFIEDMAFRIGTHPVEHPLWLLHLDSLQANTKLPWFRKAIDDLRAEIFRDDRRALHSRVMRPGDPNDRMTDASDPCLIKFRDEPTICAAKGDNVSETRKYRVDIGPKLGAEGCDDIASSGLSIEFEMSASIDGDDEPKDVKPPKPPKVGKPRQRTIR
ncbi:MAG: hypothetical protein ACYTGN_01815 [Planctomycetota bacterium]